MTVLVQAWECLLSHRSIPITQLLLCLVGSVAESVEAEVFIPTTEWQVVKEGQSIPKGLHVRMNLQTGLKEAKLMDESSTASDDEQHEVCHVILFVASLICHVLPLELCS